MRHCLTTIKKQRIQPIKGWKKLMTLPGFAFWIYLNIVNIGLTFSSITNMNTGHLSIVQECYLKGINLQNKKVLLALIYSSSNNLSFYLICTAE